MDTPSLILIDGSGFIFRAFHALPFMQNPQGTPVNAVYGFTKMLVRTLKEYKDIPLAIVFDVSRKTFRSDIYPQYKAQRPPPPDDLVPQFSLIREATRAFGIPAIELPGWEADDIIASYAHVLSCQGKDCLIVSSDKDLMQLVGEHVAMLEPIKQTLISFDQVEKKFGVTPDKVPDIQALMGDSTDNVPGVPGIGPKTAAQLIHEYHDLHHVLAAAPSMKKSKKREMLVTYKQQALISLKLVTLAKDVPLPYAPDTLKVPAPDPQIQGAWLHRMGFASLLSQMPSTGSYRDEGPKDSLTKRLTMPAYDGYHLVDRIEAIAGLFKDISQAGKCAITLDERHGELFGLALCYGANHAFYIALSQTMTLKEITASLSALLKDESILKIFGNAKRDLLILDKYGFAFEEIKAIDDVLLMSYSQSAGAYRQDLMTLANQYLGHVPKLVEELSTAKKQKDFFARPLQDVVAHFGELSDVLWRLWPLLRGKLRENQALSLYIDIERPLIYVLASMEKDGISIDRHALEDLSEKFSNKMSVLEGEIYAKAGHSFNIGSPRQLGEILFDELGLKGGKKTKSGAWRTDSKILENLAQMGHELPSDVLLWRKYAKLKSTYTDALAKQADKNGKLHTTFQMTVTTTGRLSSTDPNLQNIPVRSQEGEAIRRAFIAQDGYQLISADYSQIELRLLAHVAHIPTLEAAFREGKDIHAQTASEIFDVPLEDMDPVIRRQAKAINFGIIYGISAFGLSQQLHISKARAQGYIDRYFARYPGIHAYMEHTVKLAEEHGYVTTPFGRRCYVPMVQAKNKNIRQYAQRQAINAPLQGGGADIIKKAMVKMTRLLRDDPLFADVALCLQVHDELLLQVPSSKAQDVAQKTQTVMEQIVKLSVPLKVDVGIADNWAGAH